MHAGAGAGLTLRTQGQTGGAASVSLNSQHVPAHNHTYNPGTAGTSNVKSIANNVNTAAPDQKNIYGAAHENRQPYQVLPVLIALTSLLSDPPIGGDNRGLRCRGLGRPARPRTRSESGRVRHSGPLSEAQSVQEDQGHYGWSAPAKTVSLEGRTGLMEQPESRAKTRWLVD